MPTCNMLTLKMGEQPYNYSMSHGKEYMWEPSPPKPHDLWMVKFMIIFKCLEVTSVEHSQNVGWNIAC